MLLRRPNRDCSRVCPPRASPSVRAHSLPRGAPAEDIRPAARAAEGAHETATASTSQNGAQRAGRATERHRPNPARLRVAVDVDEVLGRFVHTLNRFCLERYDMKYEEKDYFVYEFAKIWNCTQDQSNHIVHEFFKSSEFNDGIPVIEGASDVLTRLGESCDLVVVTSRQHVIQDATLEWIDRHYPGLFQEVYFGNHWSLAGASRTKSDICKSIGASVLIDDNPSYAKECAEAGIDVLLFDLNLEYPWSKVPGGYSHPLISVVKGWDEVEHAMHALKAAHHRR